PEWHRGRTDAPMVLGPCQWDSVHIVNTLCEGSGRPYQDRAVVVAIGVAPAGAHQAVDEVPLVRARDDDRHSPVGEGLLPARASGSGAPPALAATVAAATNGHHASPRTAHTPRAANGTSQRNAVGGTRRPRREAATRNAATRTIERKKSAPSTVSGDVGCHSVMRFVMTLFVEIPVTYVQFRIPNGLTTVAMTDPRSPTAVARHRRSRRTRSSTSASPTTAGPRTTLPWTLAQATTSGTTSQAAPGASCRRATSHSTPAKRAIQNSCGRSPSVIAAQTNAPSVSQAATRTDAARRRHRSNRSPNAMPTRIAR